MKEAKTEAEQIIAAYKAEMEASYKEAQLKV
jgi:F0F1-type ATP synthase membrane subunit b/b'